MARFILICILFFVFESNYCYCESFIDIDELSSMQYGIEISERPVILHEEFRENEVRLSSKHGQRYSCVLPEFTLKPESDENKMDLELGQIVKILDELFDGQCLTLHNGWWSYKFCYKKTIEQFHLSADGKITDLIELGRFASEDQWNNTSTTDLNTHHSQRYVNGTLCDLTSQPRTANVDFYCSASDRDSFVRVEEVETCEYILTVNSAKLCTHPFFMKKEDAKEFQLICAPAISQDAYQKYMKKQEQKKDEEIAPEVEREPIDELADLKTSSPKENKEDPLKSLHSTFSGLLKSMNTMYKMLLDDPKRQVNSKPSVKDDANAAEKLQELSKENTKLLETNREHSEKIIAQYIDIRRRIERSIQNTKRRIASSREQLYKAKDDEEKERWRSIIFKLNRNLESFTEQKGLVERRVTAYRENTVERFNRPNELEPKPQKVHNDEKAEDVLPNSEMKTEGNDVIDKMGTGYEKTESGEEVDEKRKNLDSFQSGFKKFVDSLKNQVKTADAKDVEENERNDMEVNVRSFDESDHVLEEMTEDTVAEDADDRKVALVMEEALKTQLKEAGVNAIDKIKVKIVKTDESLDKYTTESNSKIFMASDSFDFKGLLLGLLGGNREKDKEEKRQKVLEDNYSVIFTDDGDDDS